MPDDIELPTNVDFCDVCQQPVLYFEEGWICSPDCPVYLHPGGHKAPEEILTSGANPLPPAAAEVIR